MADASTPQPIHLKDYRVPDYLVDRVDLDVRLDPAATEVTARLAIRRNPAAGDGLPPLVLDGQELELVGVRLDGEPLGANRYSRRRRASDDRGAAGRLRARDHRPDAARARTPRSRASTSRTAFSAPSASPRAFGASPGSRTGRT